VGVLGVLTGDAAVAGDGVGRDPAEPPGLAEAAAVGDVLQDRFDLLGRQSGIERGRALALGEAGLAGPAAEHASGLLGPVAAGHGQVSGPPLAVAGAVGIQAADSARGRPWCRPGGAILTTDAELRPTQGINDRPGIVQRS